MITSTINRKADQMSTTDPLDALAAVVKQTHKPKGDNATRRRAIDNAHRIGVKLEAAISQSRQLSRAEGEAFDRMLSVLHKVAAYDLANYLAERYHHLGATAQRNSDNDLGCALLELEHSLATRQALPEGARRLLQAEAARCIAEGDGYGRWITDRLREL